MLAFLGKRGWFLCRNVEEGVQKHEGSRKMKTWKQGELLFESNGRRTGLAKRDQVILMGKERNHPFFPCFLTHTRFSLRL